jgi:hypothetical protein
MLGLTGRRGSRCGQPWCRWVHSTEVQMHFAAKHDAHTVLMSRHLPLVLYLSGSFARHAIFCTQLCFALSYFCRQICVLLVLQVRFSVPLF